MTIKEDGNNRTAYVSLKNISSYSKEAIRKAFYFIGKDLNETSRNLILDGPKSGRIYTIYRNGSKTKHQSSAPGEAPANLTGNLRKSLGFEVRGGTQMEFGSRNSAPAAGVSPKQNVAKYAVYLELGTNKMAARPFLKPSVEKNTGNAVQHFEKQLEKQFEGK